MSNRRSVSVGAVSAMVALIFFVLILSACGGYTYRQPPADPYLEQRLRLLETIVTNQQEEIEQLSGQTISPEERYARAEAQISQIQDTIREQTDSVEVRQSIDLPVIRFSYEENFAGDAIRPSTIEDELPERKVTRIQNVELEPKRLIATPSNEAKFDGWNWMERRMARKLAEKFNAPAETNAAVGNRPDLLGNRLERKRFLGPTGEIVDLDDFRDFRNVVLVFHRGFAGYVCISCSVYTISLVRASSQFEDQDAQVLLVYPGAAESIPAFLEAIKNIDESIRIPYPILLDVDLGAVDKLDIRGSLAKPTAIIIDKQGKVSYAYTGESLDDRPSVDTLLSELKRINAGG